MMNKITTLLSTILFVLASMPASAHPGHLTQDAIHPLLHVEHIVALIACIAVAVFITSWNKR